MPLNLSKNRWFVVKIGGELAQDRQKLALSIGRSLKAFVDAGIKVALVHGAGPQASSLQQRLGVPVKMVAGRRYTDEPTLEVMKMTLAGQVSIDVAAAMRQAEVPAICTTGVSAGLVEARRRPAKKLPGTGETTVDLGLVGEVTGIRVDAFEAMAQAGFVPVLGSLCGDAEGNVFNVNADTVASHLAAELKAARLFLVSNVPGVLLDREDPKSRIPKLTAQSAQEQINAGTIQGGMIPKVADSLEMLEKGIGAVHITGIQPPDALLLEAADPGSCGTVLLK